MSLASWEFSHYVRGKKEKLELERQNTIEERERMKEEKEKLELEIKLAQIKQRDSSADSSTSSGNDRQGWSSWTTKLIPHFDEEDVGKFFRSFEKVANQLGWNKESWALLVQSVFKGRAQLAYSSLNDNDSADYDKVKSAVLTAYEMVPEAYRLKFRKYSKNDRDSYMEFLSNKKVMFEDWLRAAKIETWDDLKNAVILEDFKYNLPVSIRAHLEEFNILSAEAAAQAADRYVLSHDMSHKSRYGQSFSSFNDSYRGSSKYSVDRKSQSVSEDEEEAVSSKDESNESNSSRSQPVSRKQVVCYACQKVGHIKANCPEANGTVSLITEMNSDDKFDRLSLSRDYGKHLCEGLIRVDDSDSGQKVRMLRDSGATRSCVLRSCLPESFECQGNNFVMLGGFPRAVVSCPLEEIYLNSRRYKGRFKFAIVDTLPVKGVQVVIGNDIARLSKRRSDRPVKDSGIVSQSFLVGSRGQRDKDTCCVGRNKAVSENVPEVQNGTGNRRHKRKERHNNWLC